MTPKEVLLKAAELLEERGWCQRVLKNDEGAMCLAGAVNCAASQNPYLYSDDAKRARNLQSDFGPSWNDAPERTKDEVVALLRKTAEAAE